MLQHNQNQYIVCVSCVSGCHFFRLYRRLAQDLKKSARYMVSFRIMRTIDLNTQWVLQSSFPFVKILSHLVKQAWVSHLRESIFYGFANMTAVSSSSLIMSNFIQMMLFMATLLQAVAVVKYAHISPCTKTDIAYQIKVVIEHARKIPWHNKVCIQKLWLPSEQKQAHWLNTCIYSFYIIFHLISVSFQIDVA